MAEVEEPPAKRARTGGTESPDDLNQFSLEDLFGEDATHSGLDKADLTIMFGDSSGFI